MSEEGVYTFDPGKDVEFKPGVPRSVSMADAPGQMDDGSTNQANQLTTEVDPWLAQGQNQPAPAQPIQAAPEPIPAATEEISRMKKIIGDQGNTIGDLRKLLGTLTERMAHTQPVQGFAPQAPVRLFQNREPNDYPTAAEIQQAFLYVGDLVMNSVNQRIEEVAVQAQLSQAGLTSEEAALIKLEFPSLAALPAAERSAVIGALVKSRRTEANATQAAQVQRVAQTAQAGVRQQVYVPQPQPVSNIPQNGSQINIDAFGNIPNAAQMEKALKQLGIGRVNDFNRRG